ncbi:MULTISPECIES: hypothetical protein [Bifidobacterium]|uniref:Uncharacterized protein n=1 Tax=Bifidobacterium asteroides TaxID=1684 RepID=A0A556R9W1_9BIFI|nr:MULTISPECIES: hypothetical protein [Bifidobacterium]MBI0086627.1 hypothetical protein [Bifidobacterium sp. M0404]MCT6838667.1 hypothetical protein [Bifidobacteriales bacterium]TSJ85671.1 hypothetical protein FPK29_04740 [Bifidobacterium polysaccharolyticum]
MEVIVKPITKTVEIITDLQLMSDIVDLGNQVVGQDKRKKADKEKLAGMVSELDSKTLVLTLRGLPSSPWNAIVIDHTDVVKDRAVKDFLGMIRDAVPRMLVNAAWKDGAEVTLEAGELEELIDSLTDIQVADIIQTVQTLNTPVNQLPKAVRELIG